MLVYRHKNSNLKNGSHKKNKTVSVQIINRSFLAFFILPLMVSMICKKDYFNNHDHLQKNLLFNQAKTNFVTLFSNEL